MAYVLLGALTILPYWAVAQPPIVDFANHAARLDIACHQTDPAFAAMYRYSLGIIPNLSADLINLPLCGIAASATVLKLLISASLALIYGSAWLIQRKLFGRANVFLLLLPTFAFNVVTTMGYINYLSGIAVVMVMAALVLGREEKFGTLFIVGTIGGLILFFCHVFALMFAVIFFGGLLLRGRLRSPQGWVIAGAKTAAMFALPLLLLAFVPHDGRAFAFSYAEKIRVLIALVFANRSIGLFGLILLAPLYLALREKVIRLDPRVRLPLGLIGLFVLLAPSFINDAFDIDARAVIPLAFLFFASLEIKRRERLVTTAVAALSVALIAIQLWSVATVWAPYSRQVDEFRAATDVLPARAKVLAVRDFTGPLVIATPVAYFNVTSYATIDRHIFNPLEFTGVGMQPLYVTPAYAAVDATAAPPLSADIANQLANPSADVLRRAPNLSTRFAIRWPTTFDYVVFYHFGKPQNFNPAVLSEIRRGSFFTIYRIRRPVSPSS